MNRQFTVLTTINLINLHYQLELNISTNKEDLQRYFINGAIIGQSVNVARDYSNMPPNILTPNYFAEQVTQHFDQTSVKVDIKDGKQLLDEGFGLIHAVGKGSENPPVDNNYDIQWW